MNNIEKFISNHSQIHTDMNTSMNQIMILKKKIFLKFVDILKKSSPHEEMKC